MKTNILIFIALAILGVIFINTSDISNNNKKLSTSSFKRLEPIDKWRYIAYNSKDEGMRNYANIKLDELYYSRK